MGITIVDNYLYSTGCTTLLFRPSSGGEDFMNDSAILSSTTLSSNTNVASWTTTLYIPYSSPAITQGPVWLSSIGPATSSRPISTSTTWVTTTAIGTSTVTSTITMMGTPTVYPLKSVAATPSPTGSTGMSAIQVVGIAAAVVFGTLLLLVVGATTVLCCRRVKPPSHSFAPLKNADDGACMATSMLYPGRLTSVSC